MDPTRFDTLIRTFGTRPISTRRSVLTTLAAGVAALGSLAVPAAARRRKKRCRGGLKCDGVCIDPQTDFSNCGTCGNVCGQGQTCQGGTCVGGGGGGGACDGVDCPANTVCTNGNCVAGPDRCGGPTGICDADGTPCGISATGETCGCERTVEGNNVCVDGANACPQVVECTSSQDCEDALGFHFFCQDAKLSVNFPGQFCGCGFGTATGKVCVAECDNPGGGGGGGDACDGVDCPANFVCESGNCVAAPDRCGGPTGICNADPTPCGTSATGETCGCERTVEDNNVCVNAGDNVCTGVECTSTQDCEDALGFHFFCQEAKTNANGQFCGCGFGTNTGRVCVPECDNPNVAVAQTRGHHGKARRRNRRAG